MNKTESVVLRLPHDDKARAKKLAQEMGYSESRLYAELIHEGLLICEQMRYMDKLRALGGRLSSEEVLAILDRAPDVEPEEADINPYLKNDKQDDE
jgi:hypothetical protein